MTPTQAREKILAALDAKVATYPADKRALVAGRVEALKAAAFSEWVEALDARDPAQFCRGIAWHCRPIETPADQAAVCAAVLRAVSAR